MVKMRPRKPLVIVPKYHKGPIHGLIGKTGGTYMKVVLGPRAAKSVNYGTKTSPGSIPRLMNPLHLRDPGKWVAGHLLNDNLGGSGINTNNLTPLTQTANKQHAGYENKVKIMCEKADLYHRNNPNAPFWLGVEYTVEVSTTTFGNFSPYDCVPSHIIITAREVKVDKKTKIVEVLGGIRKNNFGPLKIHNDDKHL